jgi:hypothetical protein
MRGSGYSIETACSADAAPGALCPTLSHLSAVVGPAQVRADWAFVSPVSAVSPNLKTNRDGIAEWRQQRRALAGAFSPTLSQAGQVQMSQVFVVRQQGWDTGGTAATHIVASRPRVPQVSPTHRRHQERFTLDRSSVSVSNPWDPFYREPPPRVTLRRRFCIEKPNINQNTLRDIN